MAAERETDYAKKGTATTGAVLGGVGTGAGLLALATQAIEYINSGRRDRAAAVAATAGITLADLIALYNQHNPQNTNCSENTPLTRYDGEQIEKLSAKDAKIAELEADKKTDAKILELNDSVTNRFNFLNEALTVKFDAVNKEFREIAVEAAVNKTKAECLEKQVLQNTHKINHLEKDICEQAVYNGINTERVSCISKSLRALEREFDGLTEVVVPSSNVCSTGQNTAINESIEALVRAVKNLE